MINRGGKVMKLTIEKQETGERFEIESSKIRVAWHNDIQSPENPTEWWYEEWEEVLTEKRVNVLLIR